jgi:hypothetical protein
MQAILSGVISIFFYAMIIAAVWKLFQVASDLGEIKNLLIEMRRAKPIPPPIASTGPISLESAEALLREVAAESQAVEQHSKM